MNDPMDAVVWRRACVDADAEGGEGIDVEIEVDVAWVFID
jgi:hypothetical protein